MRAARNALAAGLLTAAVATTLYAAPSVLRDYQHLTLSSAPSAALDLRFRYDALQRWFDGKRVYEGRGAATDPPATFTVLWPFLGWPTYATARWLWAASTLVAVAGLALVVAREVGASSAERLFLAVLPFVLPGTSVTVRNGQITAHVLLLLIVGLLLLTRGPPTWRRDVPGAALMALALAKPNVAIPFVWLLLFVPGRARPAVLTAAGYAACTLLAASFQSRPLPLLLRDWLTSAAGQAQEGKGYADLDAWLHAIGWVEAIPVATLLALALLGVWVLRCRQVDIWLLLGVTALVARFWTHHLEYDDVLILVPLVALFRLATLRPTGKGHALLATGLFVLTLAVTYSPGAGDWPTVRAARSVVWTCVLAFLGYTAWRAAQVQRHTERAG